MAKLTAQDFIAALNEMSLLEIKALVDAMKEEYGVDPSAVAVAAAPSSGEVDAEPSNYSVVLTNAGSSKIAVIKLVREVTGLGLKEAKELADNGGELKANVPAEEAEALKAQFVEAGATIELK